MTLSLTCHSCGNMLEAATEDELVNLGRAHAVQHGYTPPPPEHVLARSRRHNPQQRAATPNHASTD